MNDSAAKSGSYLTIRAPAKINLFLHITGQRSDGYHELQTAFQFLSVCDTINISTAKRADIMLEGDMGDIPTGENLIYRAATALQQATDCKAGARIQIDKQLPMGGGIGGGSSDAASTLLGLNSLWNTGLSMAELAAIGLELGADVPVFVGGQAAFAEGIGEQLQTINPAEPWYLLVKPDCHVSTANIFSQQDLTRNTSPIKIAAFLSGASRTRNDCLPVVQRLYPEVGAALDWLGQFAEAYLTGTGACVFAPFDSRQAAEEARLSAPSNWQVFVTRGLNRSPAHEDLERQ